MIKTKKRLKVSLEGQADKKNSKKWLAKLCRRCVGGGVTKCNNFVFNRI